MKLDGVKINFLGDSITEGAGTTEPERCFHQLIEEKYNLSVANNYGVSGTRIARQTEPTRENTKFDLTFELRSEVMDREVDAVVVFGGTNDFGHGDAHFGDVDSDSENIYTFCGALNSLISKLKTDFPSAKIVFMTPLHRMTENELSLPDNKKLSDYVDAIREICVKRGVDVIDLFAINPIDINDKLLLPDGLHPSDAGHEIMAEVIGNALLEL